MPGHSRRTWIAALIGLLLLACCFFPFGIGQQPELRYEVGEVQIVGGPKEAWLFLEKDVMAGRPGTLASPRWIELACRQQVVIITPSGIKQRIDVPEQKEVTFHTNISRVFRHDGQFYQIQGQSRGWHASLLRWDVDHFKLLSREDFDKFVAAHGLDETLPAFDPKLQRLTERENWEYLTDLKSDWEWYGRPETFYWAGKEFTLDVKPGPPTTRLWLRCLGPEDPWEAVLMEFDSESHPITWQEYNHWWNEPDIGHRRE